jgi:hypothetical protein
MVKIPEIYSLLKASGMILETTASIEPKATLSTASNPLL